LTDYVNNNALDPIPPFFERTAALTKAQICPEQLIYPQEEYTSGDQQGKKYED
jgi:hypothetical protein